MKVIFGLGNRRFGPVGWVMNRVFETTRHNIGSVLVGKLAANQGLVIKTAAKPDFVYAQGKINGHDVALVRPTTWMNNSGRAVERALELFKVGVPDIVICHDDNQIDLGRLLIAGAGAPGGHRGVESIFKATHGHGTRLRLGIGRPPEGVPMVRFAMSTFAASERAAVSAMLETSMLALEVILERGVAAAQTQFNRRT